MHQVSDAGEVRSVERVVHRSDGKIQTFRGKMRKLVPRPDGRLTVMLSSPSAGASLRLVHQLVLEAFVGPRPEGMEGCHNNGDCTDNRLENLRWDTSSNNKLDMLIHGTHPNGSKTHCKSGHEFTAENTYLRAGGGRACRPCKRDRWRRDNSPTRATRGV